ncbi:DUF6456 domain-containing protein [Acuticoccus kandeliae]|uniref:DUF6456 domain-containing protein n=1 Tax=Acuticoccus kandeliae TaxID=2073160 RepID=UPI0013009D80|nr:DUF6456 domain-containing protein [Acuticoccus kandeliae]
MTRALRLLGEREVREGDDRAVRLKAEEGEIVLDRDLVRTMLSEGLLERRQGALARTTAGRAHLRRALSAGEGAFAAQHQAPAEREVAGGTRVAVNAAESPLAWLATRKDRDGAPLITEAQYRAGRRLHRDHSRARGEARVTQSWDASGVRSEARRDGLSVSEGAMEARRRVVQALDTVGAGLAEILVLVCCEEMGLEAVEKRLRWPARSGKVVLRLALDRLANHYGIGDLASGGAARGIIQWGAADYRPRA